jgi:hypothetical protein
MCDFATGVLFHHIHIPVSLEEINQVLYKAIKKIEAYANNVFQESLVQYHEYNHYTVVKKDEG